MADIYEFMKKSDNRRPVYTSYELSKKVRGKRKESGLSVSKFAVKYGLDETILTEIEAGKRSFSPKLYRACGMVLGLSEEELLAEDVDDENAVNYRASEVGEGIQETVDMANMLFNEMIMQEKIGVN